jgi:hypothetical protein
MREYKDCSEYVVCVDNAIGNSRLLEINTKYKSRRMTTAEKIRYKINHIIILNDDKEIWCSDKCFISLEEWRNRQISKVL